MIPRSTSGLLILSGAFALSLACGKGAEAPTFGSSKADTSENTAPSSGRATGANKSKQGPDHGAEVAIGTAELGGYRLQVSRLGVIAAGIDSAVVAKVVKHPDGADWKKTNLYVWVEDRGGKKLNAPEKAHVEKGRLHAHATIPKAATGTPGFVVVRLREGTTDERRKIPLEPARGAAAQKGAPHTHEKTPHDGILARVSEATVEVGWLELKLHDDKGDLELWLATDKGMTKPLDLAPDAKIAVTFVDHGNKRVSLAPRDLAQNPDEDGKPQMRAGKTNYFIFPGATGADARWLMGKAFQSIVSVAIEAGPRKLMSAEFVLKPHTHGPGEGH